MGEGGKMKKEIRISEFTNVSQDEMIVEGYAAVFNSPTILYKVDGIEYKEVIDRNAFNKTSFKDCCLKYNHESGVPILARTRGGSMEIKVDEAGLFFRAKLFDTQTARDVFTLVREGALDKCSFAFTIADGGDEYDRATRTRTITNIEKCYDCSIVDTPAYDATSVHARSFFDLEREKELADAREIERLIAVRNYLLAKGE